MDPVWADIDHAWVWRDGGSYYGVPISNFFGWILTTYIFYQLFALYVRNRVSIPLPTSHWRLAILFYAASAAGNLLVAAPVSLARIIHDFRSAKGLAVVQIRCLRGFETKSEAFACPNIPQQTVSFFQIFLIDRWSRSLINYMAVPMAERFCCRPSSDV